METTENPLLFAVLVPHRDCLPVLETYRRDLFAAGIDGAFSFPAVAPLALLKRPLNSGELKSSAAELRKLLGGKKIVALGQDECMGCTVRNYSPDCEAADCGAEVPLRTNYTVNTVRFFGLILELSPPVFPVDAVLQRWEKPILAPAILAPGDKAPEPLPQIPALFSRAAALANFALTPVMSEMYYSYTWKLGPLQWLPRLV